MIESHNDNNDSDNDFDIQIDIENHMFELMIIL